MATTQTSIKSLVFQVGMSEEEQKDLLFLLTCLRGLREEGGWGRIEITLKAGDVYEVARTVTMKPKTSKGAGP